jgi:hypothetical protein
LESKLAVHYFKPLLLAYQGPNSASLEGDPKSLRWLGGDFEFVIGATAIGQINGQADSNVRRVAAGTATDGEDPAATFEGEINRRSKAFLHKRQRINEVTLARAVASHQSRERFQFDTDLADTSIIANLNTLDLRNHKPRLSRALPTKDSSHKMHCGSRLCQARQVDRTIACRSISNPAW